MPIDENIRYGIFSIALTGGVPNLTFPIKQYDFLLEQINNLKYKTISAYKNFLNEQEIIQCFLKNYKKLLGNIFIRDYSWLGFPTIKISFDNNRIIENQENNIKNIFYYCAMSYTYSQDRNIKQRLVEIIDEFNFSFKAFKNLEQEKIYCKKDFYNFMFYDKNNKDLFIEELIPSQVGVFKMDMNKFTQFILKE